MTSYPKELIRFSARRGTFFERRYRIHYINFQNAIDPEDRIYGWFGIILAPTCLEAVQHGLKTRRLQQFHRILDRDLSTLETPVYWYLTFITEQQDYEAEKALFFKRYHKARGVALALEPEQKYHQGDLVRIAEDLGPHRAPFESNCDAVVVESYSDRYEGANHQFYKLYLKGYGEALWYHDSKLTLVEPGRMDLLEQWRAELMAEAKQKGDLDWIFAHGHTVLSGAHTASVQALARCLGMTYLWGIPSDPMTYFHNGRGVLALAAPYLDTYDKAGWLKFCATFKAPV
jgi:hypothetical protein